MSTMYESNSDEFNFDQDAKSVDESVDESVNNDDNNNGDGYRLQFTKYQEGRALARMGGTKKNKLKDISKLDDANFAGTV